MVAVITNTGIPLMPTSNYRARRLLNSGRAKIYRYRPFTIRLLERENGITQPVEYCCDTGYQHAGISIKSEKHEYISAQYDLLKEEPEKHNDCRKYRRQRRKRLRYRKPRFNNRKRKEGWLAPSIAHRMEAQIRLFEMDRSVYPITTAVFEMGQFDTQLLKALDEGKELPKGTDYQHGERYGIATLREAVFNTCVFCGRSIWENAILHVHHLGYRNGDPAPIPETADCKRQEKHTQKPLFPAAGRYRAV